MFNIIDEIYKSLASWDKVYADRWIEYIYANQRNGVHSVTQVCRFWALELSLVDNTHDIREHLTPTNSPLVIMDIFNSQVMPIIRAHSLLFRKQSKVWRYDA